MSNRLIVCWFLCLMASSVIANVVLIGDNATLSFDAIEANFAPPVKGSGECGTLFLADPLDACAPLTNKLTKDSTNQSFVLIVRGVCSFEDKVRRAQSAGFKAAIVYNNDDTDLVAMAGISTGIRIHAVFVTKSSGLKLSKYAGLTTMQLWILPSNFNSAWSIMAISFIALLAMSAVLATCFFVRRHRIRRERPQASRVREFHGMSSRLVKAMPSLIFTSVLEDNCTSATCAICLDDYNVGDKLRILPCRHKFHTICVDAWLTSWRTFCPVCKRDARTDTGEPPASERTPLLSSNPASMASSTALSSVYSSSYASSSRAMQIGQTSRTPSHIHSISSTPHQSPYMTQSRSSLDIRNMASSSHRGRASHLLSSNSLGCPSHIHSVSSTPHQSPYMTQSRSSLDIRNMASSSHRGRASHLLSSNSLGYPSLSPLNSRHLSSYNASLSYIWSSSQQAHPLRHSDSVASFSPYASGHSLPEC